MQHSAHLATALGYLVIGVLLMGWALRVWWQHPTNRAFRFGPYLTVEGLRIVLRHWPLIFLFGLFIFSCALDHAADWARHHPSLRAIVGPALLEALALMEAVVTVATACLVVLAFYLGWKRGQG